MDKNNKNPEPWSLGRKNANLRKVDLKIMLWCTILLLSTVSSMVSVAALGIRPAKTSLVFEEGRDYTGQFWVVNNEAREFSATISVGGEMGQYVTLHTPELNFRSDDGAKAVDFEVHLPDAVPPGESKATITVEESLRSLSPQVISSTIVLKHDILIQGPYPEKYVVAKLNFYESGEQIRLVSEVENLGTRDIGSIQTIFYVNDQNQDLQVKPTPQTSLAAKETKLLDAVLDSSLFGAGEFSVAAITAYDGQKVEVTKKLILGQPEVEITYFDTYFIAYAINQYSLELLNHWNQRLENIFVEVEVKKEGTTVDRFRTKSVDLEGELNKRINDYFDARDKGPGKYTFEMLVNFWNLVRNDQRSFTFESELVADKEALGKAEAAAGKAAVSSSSGTIFFARPWLLVTLALLVLLLLFGFYVFRRRRQGDNYGDHRNNNSNEDEGEVL